MEIKSTTLHTGFQIKYSNKTGVYSYKKIKNTASDSQILQTAKAFASVQKYTPEKYYKIIEQKIEKTENNDTRKAKNIKRSMKRNIKRKVGNRKRYVYQ